MILEKPAQDDAGRDGPPKDKKREKKPVKIVAAPQDVLLASVSLALALSEGRSQREIETLINLFSLTTDNLRGILAQKLINDKTPTDLEVLF